MHSFKALLFGLTIFSCSLSIQASEQVIPALETLKLNHAFDHSKTAFISDFHDVLVKPHNRVENAKPIFRTFSWREKLYFLRKTVSFFAHNYTRRYIINKIAKNKSPELCYEGHLLNGLDQSKPNTKEFVAKALRIMNSDQKIETNFETLNKFKQAGAYIAICSNLGPQSTKHIDQTNDNFLTSLCTNQNQAPNIWTPNQASGFIKKNYPEAKSYRSILEKLAQERDHVQIIPVLDDKQINLDAAQAALSDLQEQQPPVLPNAKIIPVLIRKPESFNHDLCTALREVKLKEINMLADSKS